jgi:hypothetical protein
MGVWMSVSQFFFDDTRIITETRCHGLLDGRFLLFNCASALTVLNLEMTAMSSLQQWRLILDTHYHRSARNGLKRHCQVVFRPSFFKQRGDFHRYLDA